jgi:hypothetical protein
MPNIKETHPIEPSTSPQKALPEKKSGGITEKVGREHLTSGTTKAPSLEQAHVSSSTFKSYLSKEVGSLAPLSIQFVESARLGTLLENGLEAFEKGNPFNFISRTGESLSIQPGEQTSFIQNFLLLLSSLLQKSEKSTQLKTFFYALLTRFVQSNVFRSSNPNWENILQKQREALSKEKRPQVRLEQAFKENPSLETLAQLFLTSAQ